MGIDWVAAKERFNEYLKEVEAGRVDYLYDPERAVNQHLNLAPT